MAPVFYLGNLPEGKNETSVSESGVTLFLTENKKPGQDCEIEWKVRNGSRESAQVVKDDLRVLHLEVIDSEGRSPELTEDGKRCLSEMVPGVATVSAANIDPGKAFGASFHLNRLFKLNKGTYRVRISLSVSLRVTRVNLTTKDLEVKIE